MLELKNITKTYKPKKGVPVEALRGIDLEIEDKGMVFILGKSGSGKSTLLNIIGGLDSADSGEIIIEGKSTKGFKEKDYDNYRNTYIGFVFQEYNILNEFSVGENISLAIELQNEKKNKERVEEILKEVGLEGYGERKPNELSGGQKQRVAIARALIKEPKIILADEPTGALDSETGKSIFELLKKLSEDKLVIVVSHDREYAEEYGDRIIELNDGAVIADRVIREIKGEREGKENKEIKKARLPYRRALAMGAKSLTKKRFRLAITIILCFLSFSAFGFSDTIIGRSRAEIGAEALYNNGDNYISFRQSYDDVKETTIVSNQILENLREKTGIDFQGVKKYNFILPLYDKTAIEPNGISGYYTGRYNVFFASKEFFDEAGFDLYGRLPENENEAVITKYIYDQFALCGVNLIDGEENKIFLPEEIDDVNKFLSKGIVLNGKKIVGIADTHVDPKGSFSWLKNIDEETLSKNETAYQYIRDNYFTNSYHSMLFVYKTLYDREFAVKPTMDTTGFGKLVDFGIKNLVDFSGAAPESSLQYVEDIVWLDGKGDRKELNENEIIVGINAAQDMWPFSSIEAESNILSGYNKTFIDGIISFRNVSLYQFRFAGAFFAACCMEAEKLTSEELEIYRQYCIERGKAFNENAYYFPLEAEITDDDFEIAVVRPERMDEKQLRLSYACYLAYERDDTENLECGFKKNILGRMTGEEIKAKYENEIFVKNRLEKDYSSMKNIASDDYYVYFYNASKLLNEDNIYFYNARDIFDDVKFSEPPKIVGIYYPKEGYPSDYAINDKLYEESQYYDNGIYDFVIAPLPHDIASIEKLAEIHYDRSGRVNVSSVNLAFASIINTQNAMDTLYPYVIWGSVILGIFCLLLLGNYIGYSIMSRKKEIGILRAMGAKRSDIFVIFINEGIIITAIILILAIIGVSAACVVVNGLIPMSYGIEISLLQFGLRQLILMMLVGYGATLLASAIPMYKLSKKKPVDIIQNK